MLFKGDMPADLHVVRSSLVSFRQQSFVYPLTLSDQHTAGRPSNTWIILTAIFILGTVGASVILALYALTSTVDQYGIVFDAGSMHTEATLFRWSGNKMWGTGEPVELDRCSVEGGSIFDLYFENPNEVINGLSRCLKIAKRKVPKDLVDVTPVYLGATGAKQLVSDAQSEEILRSIADLFESCGLKYEDGYVRIIDEGEGGIFSWISVNYLNDKLGQSGSRTTTLGSLDMDGSATQITFEIKHNQLGKKDVQSIELFGHDYALFSHSFLCWGVIQSSKRYRASLILKSGAQTTVDDPCYLKENVEAIPASEIFNQFCTMDYPAGINKDMVLNFIGKGNSDECEKIVRKLFSNETCYKMFNGSNCFNQYLIPEIKGKFVAINGFASFTSNLNMTNYSKNDFEKTGRKFCDLSYSDLQMIRLPVSLEYSKHYCFQFHLFGILIREMYGFKTTNHWKNLAFNTVIDGMQVSWDLGFMLNATHGIPVTKQHLISLIVFLVVFSIFVIIGITSFVILCYKWKKNSSILE